MLAAGICDSSGKRRNVVTCALLADPGQIGFNTGNPVVELPAISDCPAEKAVRDVEFLRYR
jgi:hypothetical protein